MKCFKTTVTTRQSPAAVGRTGWRIKQWSLIDLTVTVIVLAVANLVRRVNTALTYQCAADAGRRTKLALASVLAALYSGSRERPLVSLSVTVIVDAIADLRARADKSLASARPVNSRLERIPTIS